jgi:hypothetical protein
MYLILVGDSGIPRKSTSINMATELIRDLHADDDVVGVIGAKATPEQIDLILHRRSKQYGSAQVAITSTELTVFVGGEAYNTAMPMLLTDLYDCPRIRQGGGTIARGESEQHNVWVSFLSGSTAIWLLQAVNPKVIEGGFTSRCLFVVTNEPKQLIPWPDDNNTDYERHMLMEQLRAVKKQAALCPEIQMAPTAMEMFAAWYHKRDHSVDPFKQAFEAREDSHVLRIAALLSINDGAWEIQCKHLRLAFKLVVELKLTSGAVFEHGVMRSKYAAAFDIIRTQLIGSHDPIKRSSLVRKCRYFLQLEETNLLFETMHDMGLLRRFIYQPEMRGKGVQRTEYFHGTDKLIERGVAERVLERFD